VAQVACCMHDSVPLPENLAKQSSILMPGFHNGTKTSTSLSITVVRTLATQA